MKNLIIFTVLILLAFLNYTRVLSQQIPPNGPPWNCNETICTGTGINVYTPRGTTVPVWRVNKETLVAPYNPTWVTNYFVQQFPQAILVANATGKRNCHQYAWDSQSSNSNYWFGYSDLAPKYWLDGSYTYPASEITASKWSYFSGDHSAIAYPVGQTATVRSKWGVGPLMYHNKTYCPYMPQYGGKTTGFIAFENCPYSSNTCKAPGIFWTTNITRNSATLNWSRACNASKYQIQYKLPNGSTWYTIYTWSPPNPHFALSINVTGMSSNTCYNFRVKVINGTGFAYSTVETVCTGQSFRPLENEDDKFEGMSNLFLGEVDISIVTSIEEISNSVATICKATTNGLNISVVNVENNSSYILLNSFGQRISQGNAQGNSIQSTVPTPGIYFLSIVNNEGNKCIQKVLVNY